MKHTLATLATLASLAGIVPVTLAQVSIPESVALSASSLNKAKPGFKVRVIQATQTLGELPNTLVRTESQLAGLLLKPDGSPYENVADLTSFNADGTYDEAGFIAYAAGSFPGIPGTEQASINVALEAITYAELTPGTYSMVVNSDDGFRVTTGDVRDRAKEIELGFYDGGRGAGDTVFNFTVSKAGVYPFRLIYEQGGGGYSVDWFTANPTDPSVRVHLNEDGGIKSYRELASGPVLAPAITALAPTPNATGVSPSTGLTALIADGSTALASSSIKLSRNGADVTSGATITKAGNITKVTYKPSTLPDPLSVEHYILSFDDATATGGKRQAAIDYTLAPYANYVLPAPIWFEGFDGVAEGSLPTGWTVYSPFTGSGTGVEDLADPGSDSYINWVVISRQRVQDNSARWDAARRLNTPEAYINGVKVSSLIQTNFAYHESDTRGGSQYGELISPAINLTGKTNIYLVYNSIYEQNQDSVGGTEYSIDDGKTWLPVVYMMDVVDITKKADGTVDGEATLTAAQGDTAVYQDPVTGEDIGHSYGAFVKADKATWKDIGPYISGRINDDANESKRIEKFRLEKADNQAKVRLRFFEAGTGSWYYGVDSVGLYSITTIDPPTLTAQPVPATRLVGTSVQFTVGASGPQLAYQWFKDGTAIANATNAVLDLTGLRKSAAGKYHAVVTNPKSSVTSTDAALVVQDVPGDASSLKTGLIAYLPFDTDFNDASGNGNNGAAVGKPTIAAGRVGKGALSFKTDRPASDFNYVTLANNANLKPGETKSFTVAFWSKLNSWAGDPAFVANKNWGAGGNIGWVIATDSDGRVQWNYRRDGGPARKDFDSKGGIFTDNQWHHVVVSFDINGLATTYVDGSAIEKDASGAAAAKDITPGTGSLDAALALNIGQDGTGQYTDSDAVDGLVDDLGIWDRVLNAQEVNTLFAYGFYGDSFLSAPALNQDLGVLLKFDGNLSDSTAGGHNGTAVGAPGFAAGKIGQALHVRTDKAAGVTNYVTLGRAAGVQFGETKAFSVAFWAKINEWAGDPAFIANKNWGSGANIGWAVATDSDGRIQWNYRRDGGPARKDFDSVGGLVSDLGWHHVIVSWDINGLATTYYDGIAIDKDRSAAAAAKDITPGTGSLLAPDMALNIGQDGTGAYSDSDLQDMLIDDMALWNRVINAREAATIYGQGLNGISVDGTSGGGGGTSPTLVFKVSNGQLTFSWIGDGFGLQEADSVANAAGWTVVAGAGANSATVPLTSSAKFYRLKK